MDRVMDVMVDAMSEKLTKRLFGGYIIEKTINGEVSNQYFYPDYADWLGWRNEMLAQDGYKKIGDHVIEKENGDEVCGEVIQFRCKYIEIPDLRNFFKNLFESDF